MRRFLCACCAAALLAGCTYSIETMTPPGKIVSDSKAEQPRPAETK